MLMSIYGFFFVGVGRYENRKYTKNDIFNMRKKYNKWEMTLKQFNGRQYLFY